MIPKTIHYCWFGKKPLPELALKCIASWRKYLPDYEIIEWNENNFDVYQIPYTKQAYKCKKYAFVSDYARFKILYEHGGIYFDTDVEVIRPLDDIIEQGAFFGCENVRNEYFCAPGLGFACNPGLDICKEMLDYYENAKFILPNGQYNLKTVVRIITAILQKKGVSCSSEIVKYNSISFYPPNYFCPINYYTNETRITDKTRTIHHYAASWVKQDEDPSFIGKVWKFFRLPNTNFRKKILKHQAML